MASKPFSQRGIEKRVGGYTLVQYTAIQWRCKLCGSFVDLEDPEHLCGAEKWKAIEAGRHGRLIGKCPDCGRITGYHPQDHQCPTIDERLQMAKKTRETIRGRHGSFAVCRPKGVK